MPETRRFGIMGTSTVEVDDDGFIEVPVIIQESGFQLVGGAPPELRIRHMGIYGDDEFNKAYVAKLNRRTDLPYYLATARIKIVSSQEEITDDDLVELGIDPLPDDEE